MTEPRQAKRKPPKAPEAQKAPEAPAPGVLYIRGVHPDTTAALDEWVAERRAELSRVASDNASRRLAASFSRNDLVIDIIEAAVRARATRASSEPT